MSPGKRVAQRLFWCLLLLSMAANAAVAFLVPSDTNPYVVAGVHAVYPAMFAVSETLLVRVPKLRNRAADWVRLVCATGSALAAVAGSAKNLALLAELTGAGNYLKWTLPLVLDLPTCLAMLSTVYAADPVVSAPVSEATPNPVAVETKKLSTAKVERPALAAPDETPKAKPARPATASKPTTRQPTRSDSSGLSDDVRAALAADPALTAKELADRFEVSTKTIGRTAAWKTRKKAVAA